MFTYKKINNTPNGHQFLLTLNPKLSGEQKACLMYILPDYFKNIGKGNTAADQDMKSNIIAVTHKDDTTITQLTNHIDVLSKHPISADCPHAPEDFDQIVTNKLTDHQKLPYTKAKPNAPSQKRTFAEAFSGSSHQDATTRRMELFNTGQTFWRHTDLPVLPQFTDERPATR